VSRPGPIPFVVREDWAESFPWLIQGVTTRELDFRLFGAPLEEGALDRWAHLGRARGVGCVVHARQEHGAVVRTHRAGPPGFLLSPPCDGHASGDPGLLLTVTVADCVPVFLVAPESQAVALLHAGWRGVAEGILEEGLGVLSDRFGVGPGAVHAHLGPAISGNRYQVGPEVHRALGLRDPGEPAPLDLRGVAAERLAGAGVPRERIGVSTRCSLEDPHFFSHRGGDDGRQVAFLGIGPDVGDDDGDRGF
jgi:YfiH family protein